MNEPLLFFLAPVGNHLWQSTMFLAVMGALALLLRQHGGRVRYWLWFAASVKFLVPFALLALLATQSPWGMDAGGQDTAATRILGAASRAAAPMSGEMPWPQWTAEHGYDQPEQSPAPSLVTFFVWATGAAFVAVRWLWRWIEIMRALRKARPVTGIDFPVRVRGTERQLEPGVVGIFRAALLLPAGIEKRLTPAQMRAVLAHERCHLQWRDNLTAAVHMLVETLFWFFPPVWWIGARLIEERERACDEQVVREGHAPGSYAEGILAVCEHYIASRLPCVSGVSGADLRSRIERIVRNALVMRLSGRMRTALAVVAGCILTAPLAAGVLANSPWQLALSLTPASGAMMEYVQIGSAATELRLTGQKGVDFAAYTCPAPGAKVADRQKRLAVMVASLSPADGDKVLLFAVAANSTADVRRLLAGGAARTGDRFLRPNSLMHIAAEFGDPQMLELLANAGFDLDVWAGPFGREGRGLSADTPLMQAIASGRLDNARWLMQNGADTNAINESGNSALILAMLACRDQNLVAELIQAGAQPNDKAQRIADRTGFNLTGAVR